jgi:hypothetical protein
VNSANIDGDGIILQDSVARDVTMYGGQGRAER